MTVSVDTNVLVRYLTRDNEDEAARAKALLSKGPVLVTTTVILELAWVLRSRYGFSPDEIVQVMTVMAQTDGIIIEPSARLPSVLAAVSRGLDFADALHVAGSADADSFATFDRALARAAPTAFDHPPVVAL
jgi:predicted nucleic-acid-binding protein